jgi:hypothetical protein
MKSPTLENDVKLQESSPFIRAARDEYWDHSIAAKTERLTPDNAGLTALSDASGPANSPEIPEFPQRAIVIAKFESFQSVMTASGRTIYTNIKFRVHDWIESATKISEPEITVSVPGGTVKTLGGQVISYLTQPRDLFLEPGKVYLLILSYKSQGDFYMAAEDWDLTGGTAKPNTHLNKLLAEQGRSKIAGLSKQELTNKLKPKS